jgi:hypothetical protein
MSKRQLDADAILDRAKPVIHQQGHEIHPYGHLVKLPIALAENVCKESMEARTMARRAAAGGDNGTNDLLPSSVIRTNEQQVWFVAEHVVDMSLVHAQDSEQVGR